MVTKLIKRMSICLKAWNYYATKISLIPQIVFTFCFYIDRNGVEVHIISDANTIFIETILKANNAERYFKSITTNTAFFEENGRLRVTPFHSRILI